MSEQKLIPFETLVAKGISLSKCQVWRLEKAGKFPRRVNVSKLRVRWIESEIDAYVSARIAARPQPIAA
jgi:prophage regulatory protein